MRTITSSGKWCWVVALASFWTNFCLLGVLRSSAVVYVALVETFGVSRENAAWPSGVFGFTMCVTGAFSGFLSQYFKIRTIMMVGAILASVSVSLCCYATRMQQIVILYGALQGIGMGMIVPLTPVVLNQHFVKKRTVALGIAYAGSSAGSFVFPAVTQTMIMEYGLFGTFLLLGGIMLNSILGIPFFRDPPRRYSPPPSTNSDITSVKVLVQVGDLNERSSSSQKNCQIQKSQSWNSMNCNYSEEDGKQVIGNDTLPETGNFKKSDGNLFSRSVKKLHINQNHVEKFKRAMKLALEVLSHPSFLTISLTFAVYFSASAIFLMIVVDHALDLGNTERQGAFLVSTFSFGDLVGRLFSGWIADMKCIERRQLVTGYLILMGFLLGVVPLCHPYYTLMTLSVLLGVLNGSIIINYSVILTENLGLQKLAMAMGFSTFIIGSSGFIRPIVIGYFRDRSQSYDPLFIWVGAVQIAITFIWLIESTFHRKGICRTPLL